MSEDKFGSFLKELRDEKGLTQQQVADYFRVSDKAVSRWETGRNRPDFDLVPSIAKFYGVSIDELFDGKRCTSIIDTANRIKVIAYGFVIHRTRRYSLNDFMLRIWAILMTIIVGIELLIIGSQNFKAVTCGIIFIAVGFILEFSSGVSFKDVRNIKLERVNGISIGYALLGVVLISLPLMRKVFFVLFLLALSIIASVLIVHHIGLDIYCFFKAKNDKANEMVT